jgi:hypothetical protein
MQGKTSPLFCGNDPTEIGTPAAVIKYATSSNAQTQRRPTCRQKIT